MLNLYQFPVAGVIADLGAGDGTLVAGLLERFPELRALVLEQPAIIGNARRTLHERGVLNRCTLIAGDFFTEIPEHADLYLLKSVIHNWNDENALRILRRCRDSMAKHSRVLVIERAMNDKSDDMLPTAVRDLTMLVLFGGRDRTAEAYGKLLRQAGFAVDETRRGASDVCIIEGTR